MTSVTTCILCGSSLLTEEHVFPVAIGGALTGWILCKVCNNGLGKHVDQPCVDQIHVQLARNVYEIGGRRQHIPQPFAGPHAVNSGYGQARVTLDYEWKPKAVPTPPEVEVLDDGNLVITAGVDESDRAKLPEMVERKIRRFFASPQGQAQSWPQERIDAEIARLKRECVDAPSVEIPIGSLH